MTDQRDSHRSDVAPSVHGLRTLATGVAAAVDDALDRARWKRVDTFVESRERTVHTLGSATGDQIVVGEEYGAHTRLLTSGASTVSLAATGAAHRLEHDSVVLLRALADEVELPATGAPLPARAVAPEPMDRDVGQDARRLAELASQVMRSPDVVDSTVTFSELRRGVGCERDGRAVGDLQVRRRLHLQVRTERGGCGEDGASLSATELLDDPSVVDGLLSRALRRARDAEVRSDAPEGRLPVVFAGATSGVLVHELIGHLLEADIIASGGTALSSRLSTRVCPAPLTVLDDPTREDGWGSFRYDDEGRTARPTPLLHHGEVCGVLTDTAHHGVPGASHQGHNARRASHEHAPLPRMSNLSVAPGPDRADDVLGDLRFAVYCDGLSRGQVDPASGRFVLNMTSGRAVRSGRLSETLGPAFLTGDVLDVLASVRAVGDDPDDMQTVCGKGGQQVLVEMLAPTLLVTDIEVTRG